MAFTLEADDVLGAAAFNTGASGFDVTPRFATGVADFDPVAAFFVAAPFVCDVALDEATRFAAAGGFGATTVVGMAAFFGTSTTRPRAAPALGATDFGGITGASG